ncbi:hypothetical protein CE007_22545 [Salmonella enterica subsp. enterica serovar Newport]|nr:hypothetical protein [Salmonella enterica subsp. enterica serovar Newport]
MRFSTIVSVVTLVWGISPRQPSGKNIIRWLLKKRTNGSVRYCQYTSLCFSLIFRERLCELNIHRGNTVVQVTLAYEARK